jgi:uncharacterized membrane protein YcaP (DUF421 family)
MTGGRGNLVVGLAVSAAIVVTAWVVTRAVVRSPRLHLVVVGSPTVLVSRGVVLEQRLRRQHVSHEDLAAAMRSHGVDRLDQVRLAVLEPNGEISIVPTADVESSEVPEDPLDPPDAIG